MTALSPSQSGGTLCCPQSDAGRHAWVHSRTVTPRLHTHDLLSLPGNSQGCYQGYIRVSSLQGLGFLEGTEQIQLLLFLLVSSLLPWKFLEL